MYYADSHNDDHEPEDSSDSNSRYDMAGTLEHDIEPSDVELHHADSGICSAATSNGYSDRSSCQIGRISHVIDNHGDHNNDNVSATHGNGLDQTDDSINVYDNCKLDCGRVRRLLSDFANYVKTLPEEVPDLVTDSNINIAESECHEHAVHSFVYQEQSDHSHDPHDVLMSRGGHQESYDECHAPDDCHNGQGQSQRDDIDDKILNRAADEGSSMEAVSERNIAAFHADMDALGILRPDRMPRATRCLDAIRDLEICIDHAVYWSGTRQCYVLVNTIDGHVKVHA